MPDPRDARPFGSPAEGPAPSGGQPSGGQPFDGQPSDGEPFDVGLTDQECDTLRLAAFGSLWTVTQTDPGLFAEFKESLAGSRVLYAAPAPLRDLLAAGGVPDVPVGSEQAVQERVLAALHDSVRILRAKRPDWLDAFRTMVLDATRSAADAVHGETGPEVDLLARIQRALAD
jgi:hypothetical protein